MMNFPTADFAITLGHLLRADQVDALDIPGLDSEQARMAWWLLQGRVELARGRPVDSSLLAWILQAQGDPDPLTGLPRTLAQHALAFLRSNLPKPADTAESRLRQTAWFYTQGIREHLLIDYLPPSVIDALNAPAPSGIWPWSDTDDCTPPLLMALVWHSRSDLQSSFPLNRPEARLAFFAWFFTAGAHRLGLSAILQTHWRRWAHEPVICNAWFDTLPRIAWLKWKSVAPVQQAHDLSQRETVRTLFDWYATQLKADEDWSWLRPSHRTSRQEDQVSTQTAYPPPGTEFGVNLIGFAKGELGTGEDVRMAAAVCEAHDIPYWIINIPTGANVRQDDRRLDGQLARQAAKGQAAPYPVNIICLTGFSTATVFLKLGPSLFENRYTVGWWPWELPVWPARWQAAFDLVDEVWAATRFNEVMYAKATSKPVRRVPLSVTVDGVSRKGRKSFGLPARRFLFLYTFDFSSYLNRKNPMAALKAFRAAFPDPQAPVGLVLKTMRTRDNDPQWRQFMKACAADPRIIVLEDTLDRGDVLALLRNCDAYVSLHRSEGFGRTMAEALLMGKPVIASAWSGNHDFILPANAFPVSGKTIPVRGGEYPYVESSDGAEWFDPDIDDAARQMRAVFDQRKQWNTEAIAHDAHMRFDPRHSAMVPALEAIRSEHFADLQSPAEDA